MWEELAFVVEGEGYDLHWDMQFDCQDKFIWEWAEEPREVRVEAGRLHLHPALHQPPALRDRECRIIFMSNRIIKDMGFDWLDQLETRRASERRQFAESDIVVMAGLVPAIGVWAGP